MFVKTIYIKTPSTPIIVSGLGEDQEDAFYDALNVGDIVRDGLFMLTDSPFNEEDCDGIIEALDNADLDAFNAVLTKHGMQMVVFTNEV